MRKVNTGAMHDGAGHPARPGAKLPGERATTVRIAGFVNSLPRWLLKIDSKLPNFFRSMLLKPEIPYRSSTSNASSLSWPMPLPFPEVFLRGAGRAVENAWLKRLVSLQVAVMSWLALGCPAGAPPDLRLGARLKAGQWRIVKNLLELNVDKNTPELVDAGAMGRAASKYETAEDAVGALARAATALHVEERGYFGSQLTKPDVEFKRPFRCGRPSGRLEQRACSTAKPLVADRLNFPSEPKFDPCRYLDERTVERYCKPLHCSTPHVEYEDEVPKVKVFADEKNKVELYKKLADSGRLLPVPLSYKRGPFCSGLFAVTKDMTRDRMILDGRPANALEPAQSLWCQSMASPTALTMLWLRPGHHLLASGEDLRDFFYQFKVPFERTARNMLAEPLTVEQARYVFGHDYDFKEEPVCVGLNSLAMGDLMACEFAQGAHVGVMLQHGVAETSQLLTLHNPIPRGLHHIGVIIDDLVVLEQILVEDLKRRRLEGLETWGSGRVAAARVAYEEVGLETNPKKAFTDATTSSFWGVDLDGEKGLVRSSNSRLWPAMMVTMRVATLRLATIGLLEALAGTWVAIYGLRRRLFCLLDVIFEPLAIADQKLVVRLSDELVDELLCISFMAPMAMINLRAAYAPFLVATDASMDGLAGVATELTEEFSMELCRHSLRKSSWTTLLPPGKSWSRSHGLEDDTSEEDDTEFAVHPLWELCARGCEFKTTWKAPVHQPLHINLLEMKAHMREERRLSRRHFNKRIPFGLDSQVVLGAAVKGRAAATSLTRELKKNLGYGVGNDLYFFYMYFPSAMNRADGPTRSRAPDVPDLELPFWWNDALGGSFKEMDEWLRDASELTAERRIPFELLFGPGDEDMQPARTALLSRRKREEYRASLRKPKCSEPSQRPLACEKGEAVSRPLDDAVSKRLMLLRTFPREQFFPLEGDLDLTAPGALDLFSGSFGVAKEMARTNCPWVLTFELKRSGSEDLLRKELQDKLFLLLELGAFESVGMAPVCASFSRAVTPPVRSAAMPRGLPDLSFNMRVKVGQGNCFADFMERLWKYCKAHYKAFWLENTDLSFIWFLAGWEVFRSSDSDETFRLSFCRFGTAWRKNTRVATNTALRGVRLLCKCKNKPHVRLRGYSSAHGAQWTKIAEPYPRGLARLLARAAAVHAGWLHKDKLNIAGCCRCSSLRVGEASHPGPRVRAMGRKDTLENMPLLLPATLALEKRLLDEFCTWCRREVKSMALDRLFNMAPELLAPLLRCYGDILFQRGGALSNLRHLLLACQRWKPLSRPYMHQCWELVARWEAHQPVQHRTPLPESLVKALCVVGWMHGWYGWVLATAIAFYGGARLGEVLRCSREDLLLPCDLAEGRAPVFFRLRHFKTKFRNPASVQHLRIVDETTCRLLHLVFRNMEKELPLFDTNPYQYRKRWNLLLASLEVPSAAKLTPGGLRGGFAVMAYRSGRSIQDIMWTMRLRSQVTLESYLQETASLNALVEMSASARRALCAASKVFPLLPAACS